MVNAESLEPGPAPAPIKWAAPAPLAGVKSRKKRIFEIRSAELVVGTETLVALDLSIDLESRIAVVGREGREAVAVLLGESGCEQGEVMRHDALKVLHLCPQMLRQQLLVGDGADSNSDGATQQELAYAAAIPAAIAAARPQVIVLDQARDADCDDWAAMFCDVLLSEALRSFKGAVLVCVERGSRALTRICSERWVMIDGLLRQQPRLAIVENALDTQVNASALLEKALAVKSCNLKYWVDKARDKDWNITLFSGVGPMGVPELCGFICHHMIPEKAEFKIDFVFVPSELRGFGYGKHLLQWVINGAGQMPQSECRWISLSAVQDKVTFYEKFGFVDLDIPHEIPGCDKFESEKQTWMELRNVSKVGGAACAC